MATTNGIQLKQSTEVTEAKKASNTLATLLNSPSVKKRFDELLGKKAAGFMSSILSVVNNSKLLSVAEPYSIIAAAGMAAALDLPINQSLGFAYIVPYKGKDGVYRAQFQIGYKGLIQLALRSGQYAAINVATVYEGEIKDVNRFTGAYEFGEKESNTVIGYMAYFKLLNGFEKYLFMTVEEALAHRNKYSEAYKKSDKSDKKADTSAWGICDFETMAQKTVLKRLISKFGPVSIEMQGGQDMAKALEADGGFIEDNGGDLVVTYDIEAEDVQEEEGKDNGET